MNHDHSPAPTGRRPDFEASYHAKQLFDAPLFAVTNKELLKAARNAVKALGLNRSERQALEQLALCFGGQQLAHGLLCWPSNASICEATGMSESTVRRTLSTLCQRGLITARESANGKRFPIKNAKGEIVDARGFDLTPLHARAGEFADRVRLIEIEEQLKRQLKDDLTATRNKVYDLCAADPGGAYASIKARADAVSHPGRSASAEELAATIDSFVSFADEARAIRYASPNYENIGGYAGQSDRHSEQNSKRSIEDCNHKRSGAHAPQLFPDMRAHGAQNEAFREKGGGAVRKNEQEMGGFERAIPKDLALWREACPEMETYDQITSIDHAAATGAEIIKGCGLAHHAFETAAKSLGLVNAGLLALFVYQRHADGERPGGTPIRSPGGLFVTLAREIAHGRDELGRHLLAMQRRRRTKQFH